MIDITLAAFGLMSLTFVMLIMALFLMTDALVIKYPIPRLVAAVCTLALMSIYIGLIAFISEFI